MKLIITNNKKQIIFQNETFFQRLQVRLWWVANKKTINLKFNEKFKLEIEGTYQEFLILDDIKRRVI